MVLRLWLNLADSVLRGRRSITPAETVGARLPGYRLAFTLQALPYREPAMASVERIPHRIAPGEQWCGARRGRGPEPGRGPAGAEPWSQGPEKGGAEDRQEVHGALYRLTQGQWDYICETEGQPAASRAITRSWRWRRRRTTALGSARTLTHLRAGAALQECE